MLGKVVKPFFFIHLFASILGQVVALVLVYILSPEDYGYFALITSVAQIMYILCSGWSNASVITLGTRYYQERGSYREIIAYRGILVFSCFVLLSILFLLAKEPIVQMVGNVENYPLVYILFVGLVFSDFTGNILYPGEKNLYQASSSLLLRLAEVIYAICFVKILSDYIIFNTICQFVLFLVLLFMFHHFFGGKRLSMNLKDFKEVFIFSSWQLVGVLGVYLVNLGTNYVLRYYNVAISDIGLYNFAYKLFSGFVPIFSLMGIVIPKWIYDKSIKDKNKALGKRLGALYLAMLILYVAIYFVLEPFLSLINKEDYISSVSMYLMLFSAFIFMAFTQFLNFIILNSPYYKHCQYATILQGIGLVIISFILINRYDIYGAIYSNALSFAISSVYYIILYYKKVIPYLKTK